MAADPSVQPAGLVEHFFRHETGRLHGTLIRLVGVHNLTLAEDVAQEAMLRALRTWAMGGIPPNPSAWITQVAKNLALDALRRQRMAAGKEGAIVVHQEQHASADAPTDIRDEALRLMFVCCHPDIAPDAQVIMALKVLCGFSTPEIAAAFLTSPAAIDKQLTRTKQRIAAAGIAYELPEGEDLTARLAGVHSALYLLFNEGYKASGGDRLLREDLCQEAVRLTALLVEHPAGNTPRSHALLALMLLTAARFPSRLDEHGILTAGFTIGGTTSKTVLIRVTGPALTAFGLTAPMADPTLTVFSGQTPIASNAGWGGKSAIATADSAVGAFPLTDPNSADSALLISLAPGLYSVQATSASGTAGAALIEVYEVP